MDKAHIGWHRQTNVCSAYDAARYGPLKFFPSMGHGGNKATRAVFAKYMMKVSNQMLYLPVKHGVGPGEIVPTSGKSGGSTGSARSIDNAEQCEHDTYNTDAINLSAGEDDTPSIVRSPKAKKQKVCKSPTIIDMLVTQRKMNPGIRVKVGQRSHVAGTPPKTGRHGGFRSVHVPTPLVVREHVLDARMKVRKVAMERSLENFPDVDPSLEPMKHGTPLTYTHWWSSLGI